MYTEGLHEKGLPLRLEEKIDKEYYIKEDYLDSLDKSDLDAGRNATVEFRMCQR